MGCDYIRNLKVDKENNKILCDIADGNISPLTYYNCEIFKHKKTFEEKYAGLVYELISRNASI